MKILFTCLVAVLITSVSLAETIHLKDGRTVEGKILQQDTAQVKVDVNGLAMTYYVDEIKDIDGKSINVSVPPPVAPAQTTVVTTTKTISPVPQFPFIKPDDAVEKRTLILKFIDVFGTRKAMERNLDAMLTALAQQKPAEAKKLRDNFKIDEVIERLIPLYDKHFTSDELKAYIEFYSSFKGKKLIGSISSIMKESVQVSADYVKEKFPEMAK